MRHASRPSTGLNPSRSLFSFRQINRTALGDADNHQGPDGGTLSGCSTSLTPLFRSCGRFTDHPIDHSAARSPRSREFPRVRGRASGVRVMGGSADIGVHLGAEMRNDLIAVTPPITEGRQRKRAPRVHGVASCPVGVPGERHQRCAHGAEWAGLFGWEEEVLLCLWRVGRHSISLSMGGRSLGRLQR